MKLAAAIAEAPAEDPAAPANDSTPAAFEMPAHFRAKRLKAAWQDLVQSTDASLHVKEHRFTFEFAATLMAKFRGGVPMTATESKQLNRLLVTLGLAKDEDAGDGKGKQGKGTKYLT